MGVLTQTPTTTASGSVVSPVVPDWYSQAQNTIANQGAAIAATPYQAYGGPTVAALTPDQQNAMQMTQNLASGTQVDPSQMQGAINYGLSGFDPNQVQQFMSPYTSGVVNEISRLGQQNLQNNVMPSVNSTFAGAGQFGSMRNGTFLNNAIQNNDYNVLGQQAQALNTSENNAMSNYTAWHNNAIPAAQQANALETANAANLNSAGTLQQTQDQNNLNAAQTAFNNQTAYPQQQLNWYANLTNDQQMPAAGSTANTQTAMLPSGLQTAASVYGLMQGVNNTGAVGTNTNTANLTAPTNANGQ